MKWKSLLVDIVCILLIILFVYAALSKFLEMKKFQVQLGQSPLLTEYATLISWAVPLLEIIIAITLSVDKTRYYALLSAFTLMLLFSGYIFAITRFSSFVPCSCGGILEKMSWDQHLIFNLFFVFSSFVAIMVFNTSHKNSLLQHNQEYAENL